MAISTLQTVENALKTYFKDPIITQLDNQSGPILAKIEKSAKNVVGNKFKFPLEYGRSGGVGARTELGDLPTPSPRKYAQAEAETKNIYARMSLSDKLLKTSRDSKASFVDQFTRQMDNLLFDANDMLRRMVCGTYTGEMGKVAAAVTAGKEITVADGRIYQFYPGQLVDIGTVDDGVFSAEASAVEIADVDIDSNKIYMVSNVTVSKDAIITLAGNFGLELTGLQDIMNLNVLYGVDRTANRWFKPVTLDKYNEGVAQQFDSMWMQSAIDEIYKRTGERPDFFVCNDGVQRAYVDEQNTYKRNIQTKVVDGGYNLVTYNDIPITVEKYMPKETMYAITTPNLYLGRLADWDWMDEDGAILHRVSNKPAYEASLVMYGDLICQKPAANAVIKGIEEVE